MATKVSISTCLWFDKNGEDAAKLYVSLFEDAKIKNVMYQGDQALTVSLTLNGHDFMFLNGGPMYKLSEAASIVATCDSQAEVDRLWDKLTSDGGQASRCGWLKDKFGVSWQIIPAEFMRMATDKDGAKVGRMMGAMMKMQKLDLPVLKQAFDGK